MVIIPEVGIHTYVSHVIVPRAHGPIRQSHNYPSHANLPNTYSTLYIHTSSLHSSRQRKLIHNASYHPVIHWNHRLLIFPSLLFQRRLPPLLSSSTTRVVTCWAPLRHLPPFQVPICTSCEHTLRPPKPVPRISASGISPDDKAGRRLFNIPTTHVSRPDTRPECLLRPRLRNKLPDWHGLLR